MGTRQANGEAKIEKRGDSYRTQVLIAGRRRSITGKTIKEVQRKRRDMLANADKGVLPVTEKLTLAQHVERWLESVVKHSVRPRTHQSYTELMRLYVLPALGTTKLANVQPAQVQRLYGDLLDRGLSPRTVHHAHTVLHTCLEQAVKWDLCPRNVAAITEPPKVPRKEAQALTPAQVRTLIESVKGTRWETLVKVAIGTGMRQGELLGLKWCDIDLEGSRLQVRRQLGRDKVLAEIKAGKGRSIDLPRPTVAALWEHRRVQLELRLLAGPEWEDSDLVFCTHQGKALGHRNVLRAFSLILERSGLPHVPFHALRHTAATLLFLQNVPAKVIQGMLGHSTIQMTMDTYSHLMPGMGRDAANSLDRFLS